MAQPLYYIDYDTDQFFPRIKPLPYDPGKIGLDNSDGMMFGMAKQELLKAIRQHRDHWAALLRDAKTLTENDVTQREES